MQKAGDVPTNLEGIASTEEEENRYVLHVYLQCCLCRHMCAD